MASPAPIRPRLRRAPFATTALAIRVVGGITAICVISISLAVVPEDAVELLGDIATYGMGGLTALLGRASAETSHEDRAEG